MTIPDAINVATTNFRLQLDRRGFREYSDHESLASVSKVVKVVEPSNIIWAIDFFFLANCNAPTIYHPGPPNGEWITQKPQLQAIRSPSVLNLPCYLLVMLPPLETGLGSNCFRVMQEIQRWDTRGWKIAAIIRTCQNGVSILGLPQI
jgi:hypothetical protein